jgi:hypothetical protein
MKRQAPPGGSGAAVLFKKIAEPASSPVTADPQELPATFARLLLLAMVVGAACGGVVALIACRWACSP